MELAEEESAAVDTGKAANESIDNMEKLTEEVTEIKEEKKRKSIPCLKTLSEMKGNQMVIDLESGSIKPRKLTGPELLYQKFLKTQGKPKVNKEKVCMMNILSMDSNGKLGLQRVEVKLDKEVELDHNRPGLSREKLKQNLRNKIVQKRLEIIKTKGLKCEYEPEEKECKRVDADNKENQHHTDDSDDDDYDPEAEEGDESDDGETVSKRKKEAASSSAFVDSEAIDEDDAGDSQEEDDEESSDESEEEVDRGVQNTGRILKAFVDSDDEDGQPDKKDETDALNSSSLMANEPNEPAGVNSQATDFTFDEPSVSEEIVPSSRLQGLFDSNVDANEEDLMDLCSGQFFATQASKQPGVSQDVLPSKQSDTTAASLENELEPLATQEALAASGSADQTQANATKDIRKLLESTDDEADSESEEAKGERKKEIRKKKKTKSKQKVKKLGFSDDESEAEAVESAIINAQEFQLESESKCDDDDDDDEEEVDNIDNPEDILIDYDSEENEIEVKMTKKEKIKEAQKYFENEAELSESEWGSADEDEKDMDKYEIDVADDEHFDEAKLREEVGRIHARKVMDEDLKNVKKIQELLFEDEENDGIGRERKFRWKNQSEGFTMEDENARDADDNQNELEDDNEAVWRRMRHERDTLINEQSQKMMLDSDTLLTEDILLLDQSSQTVTSTSTSTIVKRKFQIIRTSSSRDINSEIVKKESPFLIKADQRKFNTNSFLSKGEKTLAKIASFMSNKGGDDEVTNMSSHGGCSISGGGGGGGNSMSFAPIEKNVEGKKKRKSDNEDGGAQKAECKKRKVENHRFMLDQLA